MSVTARLLDGTEESFEDAIEWQENEIEFADVFEFEVLDEGPLLIWRGREFAPGEREEAEIKRFDAGRWTSVRGMLWHEASYEHTGWHELGLEFPEPQMVLGVRLSDDREDVFRDGVISSEGLPLRRAPVFYRHRYELQGDESLLIYRVHSPFDNPRLFRGKKVGHYAPGGWTAVRHDVVLPTSS